MVCAQGSSKSVTQTFPFRPHVLAQNFAKSLTSYFQASVLRSRKRLWSRLFLSSVIRKLYLPASLFICRDYCNDLIVNKQRRPNWKSCMNSLFKKLKDNYTQTFIYILLLRVSEYIFPIFDRYLSTPLQKKISSKKITIQRLYPGNQEVTCRKIAFLS